MVRLRGQWNHKPLARHQKALNRCRDLMIWVANTWRQLEKIMHVVGRHSEVPLHPDLGIVAQCGRMLLRQDHQAAPQAAA